MSEHYSRTLSFPQHKVRGLSIVNRILALIVIISAITMITLFSQAVSRNNERDGKYQEAHSRNQGDQLVRPDHIGERRQDVHSV